MASLQTKLEEVFVHNIEPFYMDMVWANITESNENPCILYGASSANVENPLVFFSEMLDVATQDISVEQELFMLKNRREEGSRAVILKVSQGERISDSARKRICRGLFTNESGLTYKFHFEEKPDEKSIILFENVRTGKVYQNTFKFDFRENWKNTYYDTILRTLSTKCHETIAENPELQATEEYNADIDECKQTDEPLPPSPFTVISDSNALEFTSLEAGYQTKFKRAFKVDESGRKIVYKDNGREARDKDVRDVKFYKKLEDLCYVKSSDILIVALHECAVEQAFKDVLEKRKIRNQVIIITQKDEVCKQFSFQHVHVLQLVYYKTLDHCVWAIVPLKTHSDKTARAINFRHGSRAFLNELIIIFEGKEDSGLIKAWKSELLRYLRERTSSVILERMDELGEHLSDFTSEKTRALIHMLEGTQLIALNGKNNLADKAKQLCKLSVPLCIVVDADAMFSVDSERGGPIGARDISIIRKKIVYKKRWCFELRTDLNFENGNASGKAITWKESPVAKYISFVCESKKARFNDQYRLLKNTKEINDWNSFLANKVKLLADDIFHYSQQLARVFAWKHGDGTISGAMGMDKSDVKNADNERLLEMTKESTDLDAEPKYELRRFFKFVMKDVFDQYCSYRHHQLDSRTKHYGKKAKVNVRCEDQSHVVQIGTFPKDTDSVLDDTVLKTKAKEKGDELLKDLKDLRKERLDQVTQQMFETKIKHPPHDKNSTTLGLDTDPLDDVGDVLQGLFLSGSESEGERTVHLQAASSVHIDMHEPESEQPTDLQPPSSVPANNYGTPGLDISASSNPNVEGDSVTFDESREKDPVKSNDASAQDHQNTTLVLPLDVDTDI